MKTPNDLKDVFKSFSLVASEFCSAVDSARTLERSELLSRLYEILPRLIQQGMALPAVSCTDHDTEKQIEQTRMKKPDWGQLYEVLKTRIGEWDLYWQVFDPTKDSEAVRGSLADDIADIYRDVNEGIKVDGSDVALQQDAIFNWRVLYYSHWGQHAINALYTVHFLLQNAAC